MDFFYQSYLLFVKCFSNFFNSRIIKCAAGYNFKIIFLYIMQGSTADKTFSNKKLIFLSDNQKISTEKSLAAEGLLVSSVSIKLN